ncbi:MAG: SPFH domain-containing protein [Candidatus Spechtbacterales bacterium]
MALKALRKVFLSEISITLYMLAASAFAALTVADLTNNNIGIAVFMLVMGWYIFSGMRRIEADPPHVAAVTILGQRTGDTKEEGWRFFPLYPYFYGYIAVEITRIDFDLPHQKVRTPDFGELEIPVGIVFHPSRKYIINYLNSGGEKGVKDILQNIVHQSLRTWAFSDEHEPRTVQEGMMASDEAVAVLAKSILGSEMDHIPSSVPTPVLLRYFEGKPPAKPQIKNWGRDWTKVESILKQEQPTQDEMDALRESVECRREIIRELKRGKGTRAHRELGIVLTFLNIGGIQAIGKTAEVIDRIFEADKKNAIEKLQRSSERTETRTRTQLSKEMQEQLGISGEAALEATQVEAGKIKKEVNRNESSFGIEPKTRSVLLELAEAVVHMLKKDAPDES